MKKLLIGCMNNNVCYIAAAGAGKTTFIINKAAEVVRTNMQNNVAIITFTTKNQENIKDRIRKFSLQIVKRIHVIGWYEFLLRYIIRPYKGTIISDLYDCNISLLWSEANQSVKRGGIYVTRYNRNDLKTKYLKNNKIYKNYISEFACECANNNSPECMCRLSKIFSHIFIDEAQDLSGYDFEFIKKICLSDISTIIVGDPRQRTYSTNNLRKYKKYSGKIDEYLTKEVNTTKKNVVRIDYFTLNLSHRCGSQICSIASTIHPHYNATKPCQCEKCKEVRNEYNNGISQMFWVKENVIDSFIQAFNPIALTRHRTKVVHSSITIKMTMGESKGIGTRSVLIYPTSNMLKFFKSQKPFDETEMARLYVAITRATHIVGIVVPNDYQSSLFDIEYWK